MRMRLLHTMIRVYDLNRSIDFYTNILEMRLLKTTINLDHQYSLAFIGYGAEEDNSVIELTYNWNQTNPYDIGSAYGHIALGVENIFDTCLVLRKKGVVIVREAGPVKGGTTKIAFIKDPDGYLIEIIEK